MRIVCEQKGTMVSLVADSPLGRGGEANVYAVQGDARLVAKIYHQPKPEQAQKLAAMLRRPQIDMPTGVAWPLDLLRADGQVVGYLMPRLTESRPLFELYNPGLRRQRLPHWHYGHLHLVAHNLAALFAALHQRGLVVGDVNESNLLVSPQGFVTLIDTDSMPLSDPQTNATYRCPVGKAEYTAPEIQRQTFAEVERTMAHDLFGLGVLLFQLLMEGMHPFAGKLQREEGDATLAEQIANGQFPYVKNGHDRQRPPRTAPPFELLAPRLQQLFQQCFVAGHHSAAARPTAAMWQSALQEAMRSLVTCEANSQHVCGDHWDTCPWCQRAYQLRGSDPFPLRLTDLSQMRPLVPSTPSKSCPRSFLSLIGAAIRTVRNCVYAMLSVAYVIFIVWMFWQFFF